MKKQETTPKLKKNEFLFEYETTEYKSTRTKHKKIIKLPIFWVDEYKYVNGSFDGKSTICIGLNGRISDKEGTHSIATRNYLCSTCASEKSKQITKEEFAAALTAVHEYCSDVFKKIKS